MANLPLPTDMSYTDGQSGWNAFEPTYGHIGYSNVDGTTLWTFSAPDYVKVMKIGPSAYTEFASLFNVDLTGKDFSFAFLILSNYPGTVACYHKNVNSGGTVSYNFETATTESKLMPDGNNYYVSNWYQRYGVSEIYPATLSQTGIYSVTGYSSINSAIQDSGISPIATFYPITYHYTNSVVSGPSEAAVGDTVTVSAVPNNNYGITDPASQILVTNNDVAVSYNWNPSTNTITFTMPDPS